MNLLLLTDSHLDVLPALDLLPYSVQVAPPVRWAEATKDPQVAAVLVDACGQLNQARATCRLLRANGLVAVPAGGGAYRVVPDDTAAQQPGSFGGASLGFSTQVVPLTSIDARIAAETLKPLVGRGGVVVPTPQGNALLDGSFKLRIIAVRIARGLGG